MTDCANFQLSRALYCALGKPNSELSAVTDLYVVGSRSRCLGRVSTGWRGGDFKYFIPAYSFNELFQTAILMGLHPLKFTKSQDGKKMILTGPPCYHIEGTTAADTLAKLLIRTLKKKKATKS